jgi:hypothetical protein
MMTNTKQTPKSCSCSQCLRGKHTRGGHSLMKADERAYRHNAKIVLDHIDDLDEKVFNSGPIGNYYD